MNTETTRAGALATGCCFLALCAAAQAEELTEVGAEKAGLENGPHGLSIPAWDGGWHLPDKKGSLESFDNPFDDDDELLEIEAEDVEKYADVLSEGQKALFRTYPDSYKIEVYPSRRTAVSPQSVREASVKNLERMKLVNNGSGIEGAQEGVPFPRPKSGIEAMWNHVARYRTSGFSGYINSAVTTKSGDYQVERSYFEIVFGYNNPVMQAAQERPMIGWILAKVVAPANKAGDSYLLHVPLDRSQHDTLVWIYNQGTRKVRRIGEVGYDNPARDGLITQDQIDMFNGPFDRYDFKLVGKKPFLVPYNTEKLHSKDVKYDDIIKPGHINQDLVRYELHRLWVVEATRKPEAAHIYARRVFYLDEDSWLILMQDIYDERGEFWRYAESYARQYPQIPLLVNAMQTHYDLQSRRYVILNMSNEEKNPIEYDIERPLNNFSTSALKRFASKRF